MESDSCIWRMATQLQLYLSSWLIWECESDTLVLGISRIHREFSFLREVRKLTVSNILVLDMASLASICVVGYSVAPLTWWQLFCGYSLLKINILLSLNAPHSSPIQIIGGWARIHLSRQSIPNRHSSPASGYPKPCGAWGCGLVAEGSEPQRYLHMGSYLPVGIVSWLVSRQRLVMEREWVGWDWVSICCTWRSPMASM